MNNIMNNTNFIGYLMMTFVVMGMFTFIMFSSLKRKQAKQSKQYSNPILGYLIIGSIASLAVYLWIIG